MASWWLLFGNDKSTQPKKKISEWCSPHMLQWGKLGEIGRIWRLSLFSALLLVKFPLFAYLKSYTITGLYSSQQTLGICAMASKSRHKRRVRNVKIPSFCDELIFISVDLTLSMLFYFVLSYILMAEPDHIIVKPIPNLSKDGLGAAFPFFYIEPKKYESVLRKYFPEDKGPITNIDPIGNSPVIVGKVCVLICSFWLYYSSKYWPFLDCLCNIVRNLLRRLLPLGWMSPWQWKRIPKQIKLLAGCLKCETSVVNSVFAKTLL